MAATLGNLGNICAVSGRREAARTYYQEVLELQKILGDEKGIGTTLGNLGNLRADVGEWDRAKAYYLEALDLMCKTHDDAGKAVLFSDLGLVARETKAYEQAMRERAYASSRSMTWEQTAGRYLTAFENARQGHWLKVIARVDPLTYAVHGLRAVVLKNVGWEAIHNDVIFLTLFSAVFYLGILIFFPRHL